MFDIGFWELLFISVLGLLVLGPERLPRVARTVGLWAGRARGMVRKLQREIDREITLADIRDRQIKPQTPPADTSSSFKSEQTSDKPATTSDERNG